MTANGRPGYILKLGALGACDELEMDSDEEDYTHTRALDHLESAASHGDAVAQTKLGVAYSKGGFGVEPDEDEAKRYFDEAVPPGTVNIVDPLEFRTDEGVWISTSRRNGKRQYLPTTIPSSNYDHFCKFCRRRWCRHSGCGCWSGEGPIKCGDKIWSCMYFGPGEVHVSALTGSR